MSEVRTLRGSKVEFSRITKDIQSDYISYVTKDLYQDRLVKVTKEFEFDAGHFIPNHPKRCRYVHGHRFKLVVTILGPINEEGVVVDFQDLSSIVSNIVDKYDHGFLNDYYEYPTAEILACHFKDVIDSQIKLINHRLKCSNVRLYETPKCYAEVGD